MCLVVIAQALKEGVVAQSLPQHVQDPGAFLVIIWIEQLVEVQGFSVMNRAAVLIFINKVALSRASHVRAKRFFAVVLFDEQSREICSKAFAQPKIGPGGFGD